MGWQKNGLCAGRTDEYLTENLPPGDKDAAADALCAGCPVFEQCIDLALKPIYLPTTTKRVAATNEDGDPVMIQTVVEPGYVARIEGIVMAGIAF